MSTLPATYVPYCTVPKDIVELFRGIPRIVFIGGVDFPKQKEDGGGYPTSDRIFYFCSPLGCNRP